MFSLESPDFKEGQEIPREFSCEGDDLSPELMWHDPPVGTKGFTLIAEDPDAPMGTFTHWIVYDMPSTFHEIYRGMGNDAVYSDGIKMGVTDFGHTGYGGPCPPKGSGAHRYRFRLMALDIPVLGLPDASTRSDVEIAMQNHIIDEADLTGIYGRH